eukprot:m.299591 g.299591  ORF g.299591 m.299591 type:complete len:1139 (+) comp15872_c1_seq3:134-3550(+)
MVRRELSVKFFRAATVLAVLGTVCIQAMSVEPVVQVAAQKTTKTASAHRDQSQWSLKQFKLAHLAAKREERMKASQPQQRLKHMSMGSVQEKLTAQLRQHQAELNLLKSTLNIAVTDHPSEPESYSAQMTRIAALQSRIHELQMKLLQEDMDTNVKEDGLDVVHNAGHAEDSTFEVNEQFTRNVTDTNTRRTRSRRNEDRCSDETHKPTDATVIETKQHSFKAYSGGLVLVWIGKPHGEVMALTTSVIPGKSNAFCSTDYGQTYKECPDIDRPIYDMVVGPQDAKGNYWIFALPSFEVADYKSTDAFNLGKGFFVSKDHGKSFQFHAAEQHYTQLVPHPTDPTKLMGLMQDEDHLDFPVDDVFYITGYEQGAAQSFRLAEHAYFTEWLQPQFETLAKVDTILLTKFRKEPKENGALDLVRIESPSLTGGKIVTVKENCYHFEQSNQYIFATQLPKRELFDERELFVSTDEGQTFASANLPFNARHNHFKVVDASEDFVFLVVQHTVTTVEGDTFILRVDTPGKAHGNYTAAKALFSPVIEQSVLVGELFVEKNNPRGCTNKGGVSSGAKGMIVLLDRKDCPFSEKIQNAEDQGAVGVIIANSDEDLSFRMGVTKGDVLPTIPAFMVTKATGDKLKKYSEGTTLGVSMIEEGVEERSLLKTSNLFASDNKGVDYTVSLNNVAYVSLVESQSDTEIVDVFKVQSQTGTYIATWITSGGLISVITFNKGASWQRLDKPVGADCRTGSTSCSLHIALEYSSALSGVPLPLSTASATGVVLAHGHVGDMLSTSADTMQLYLSTDNGFSWKAVANGVYTYQILDHGGAMVAASMTEPSSSILYTVDYGQTEWEKKDITENHALMYLTTEPGGTTLVAYSYFYDFSVASWIGVHIDFQGLLNRPCDVSDVGGELSDYEIFVLGDPTVNPDQRCLLGVHMPHLRRIACRLCYNGLDHESSYQNADNERATTCLCTPSDYRCSFGFVRENFLDAKSSCVLDTDFSLDVPCPRRTKKTQVQNYMKIPDNDCDADVEFEYLDGTVEVACTSRLTGGAKFGVFIGVSVGLVLVIAIALVASRTLRAGVVNTFGTEYGLLGAIGRFCVGFSCFRRRTTVSFSEMRQQADLLSEYESDDDMLMGIEDARIVD